MDWKQKGLPEFILSWIFFRYVWRTNWKSVSLPIEPNQKTWKWGISLQMITKKELRILTHIQQNLPCTIISDSKLLGLNRALHRGRVKLTKRPWTSLWNQPIFRGSCTPGAGTGTWPLCHLLCSIRHVWGKAEKGTQAGEHKKKESCKEAKRKASLYKWITTLRKAERDP